MESLKQEVIDYVQLKDEIKKLIDRKKNLEKHICLIMDQHNISALELPDGSNLNYLVKESLTLTKDKQKPKPKQKTKTKTKKTEDQDD